MVVKGKKLTLKERWQKVKQEFEGMDREQKWEHFWAYYWWTLLVLALFVLIICIIVSSIISAGKETVFAGTVLNMPINGDGHRYLQEDFLEQIRTDDNQLVGYSYRNFVDPYSTTERTYSLDVHEDVTSMITSGQLDYMIYDITALPYFMNPQYLSDLRVFFTDQELAAMGSAVMKLYMEETGELVPVAINIRDTEFVRHNVGDSADYYISFIYKEQKNGDNRELCRKFWQHLKGGQTDLLNTRLAGCAVDANLDGQTMNERIYEILDCRLGDERTELVSVSFLSSDSQTKEAADKVKAETLSNLEKGRTDYLLCGEDSLKQLNTESLLDLRMLLSESELAALGDRVLYTDEGVPVALKLSQKDFEKDYGLEEELWLVFSARTERTEDCRTAARSLLLRR